MMLVFYNTGARVSEIVDLDLDDLRLDGVNQVRLTGKGGKTRSGPLWPETVQALQRWLAVRQPHDPTDQALFLNARGRRLTRFGIRYRLRKHGLRAQENCPSLQTKTLTPHVLRHTTAMHLVRTGSDLSSVSYWLGHAHLNTTHHYFQIDMKAKQRMLDKTSPPQSSEPPAWHRPDIREWLKNLQPKAALCDARP